ncbi:hypothetical protein CU098_003152, partial [Rhizopus stolonifer]
NQQRLVEFFDSRACVAAYDATIDAEYKGGRWDVAFFWDHPYKERTNSHQRRERNPDRDEMKNRRRDHMKRDNYDHYSGGGQRMDDRYGPSPMQQHLDPRLQYAQQPSLPPLPTGPMASTLSPDNQRLEQAQKAQHILSMLAQQPPPQPQPIPSLTSPFQPTNLQSPASQQVPLPMPVAPQPFVPPVPPTNDQASQVQQLLGLLGVAPIPGMDATTALQQLAALLNQHQPPQNQ